jgi:hypothetical protein
MFYSHNQNPLATRSNNQPADAPSSDLETAREKPAAVSRGPALNTMCE